MQDNSESECGSGIVDDTMSDMSASTSSYKRPAPKDPKAAKITDRRKSLRIEERNQNSSVPEQK